MKTVYLVRHQALGFLTGHAYAQEPTEDTLEGIRIRLAEVHGDAHPKTGEVYWCGAVAIPLEGDASQLDTYEPPAPAPPPNNQAGPGDMTFSGVGTVTNP